MQIVAHLTRKYAISRAAFYNRKLLTERITRNHAQLTADPRLKAIDVIMADDPKKGLRHGRPDPAGGDRVPADGRRGGGLRAKIFGFQTPPTMGDLRVRRMLRRRYRNVRLSLLAPAITRVGRDRMRSCSTNRATER